MPGQFHNSSTSIVCEWTPTTMLENVQEAETMRTTRTQKIEKKEGNIKKGRKVEEKRQRERERESKEKRLSLKLCRHYFSSKNFPGNYSALFPALSPLESMETNVSEDECSVLGGDALLKDRQRGNFRGWGGSTLLVSCYNFHERADARF